MLLRKTYLNAHLFRSHIEQNGRMLLLYYYIEKKLDERELNCLWRTLEIDLLKTLLNFGGNSVFYGYLILVGTFSSLVRKCLK